MMRHIAFWLLVSLIVACGAPPRTLPRPIADRFLDLPDSIAVPAGMVDVQLVDSIPAPRPDYMVLGRLDYLRRTIYISRVIKSPVQAAKVLEHERCHLVLLDSGIQLVLSQIADYTLVESLCDAFATARLAELSRTHR
jgi:hypothetical protein